MKKISEILSHFDDYQYLLGGIFSFMYQTTDNNFVFLSYSKRQKTNAEFDFEKYYREDKLQLQKQYGLSFQEITSQKLKLQRSLGKNCFGIYLELENDENLSKNELSDRIWNSVRQREQITEFVRGMWEVSGSLDVKFDFLSRDMNKELGPEMALRFVLLTNRIAPLIHINVNPRYSQPGESSKIKNPQIRIKLFQFLHRVGLKKIVLRQFLNFRNYPIDLSPNLETDNFYQKDLSLSLSLSLI